MSVNSHRNSLFLKARRFVKNLVVTSITEKREFRPLRPPSTIPKCGFGLQHQQFLHPPTHYNTIAIEKRTVDNLNGTFSLNFRIISNNFVTSSLYSVMFMIYKIT